MKFVKYFFGMLLIASVFVLASCKDDDKPEPPVFSGDYPEAPKVDGKITIFAKFEAGAALCENGVVALAGSYYLVPKPDKPDETDWGTNPGSMLKFTSAGVIDGKDWGADGWYKVTVDITASSKIEYGDPKKTAVLGVKPVHLKGGKFDWDYQIGDKNSVEFKSGDIDITDGFSGECNIYFSSNATAAFIFKKWKKDPCVDLPSNSYTFNVTVPEGTPEDAKVTIVGKFGPDGTPLYWNPGNEDMILTKGADGKYSITLEDVEEGTSYKYVLMNEAKNWDNEERAADEEDSDCAPVIDDRTTGSSTTINDVVENWKGITTCIMGEETDVTFIVTVPEGTPDDAKVFIAGAMNDWKTNVDELTKNDDGTYSITLEGIAGGTEYKYVLNNDGGEDYWTNVEKADTDGGCAGDVVNRKTVTGQQTIEDEVFNWNEITTCIESVKHDYTFTVTVPEGTPEDAKVFIAGAMNDWKTNVDELTKNDDGTYSITLEDVPEYTGYKYVLNGSWDYVELAATDGDCADDIADRKTGDEDEIENEVLNWKGITTCIPPSPPFTMGEFTWINTVNQKGWKFHDGFSYIMPYMGDGSIKYFVIALTASEIENKGGLGGLSIIINSDSGWKDPNIGWGNWIDYSDLIDLDTDYATVEVDEENDLLYIWYNFTAHPNYENFKNDMSKGWGEFGLAYWSSNLDDLFFVNAWLLRESDEIPE